jgi:hypothetical protein
MRFFPAAIGRVGDGRAVNRRVNGENPTGAGLGPFDTLAYFGGKLHRRDLLRLSVLIEA